MPLRRTQRNASNPRVVTSPLAAASNGSKVSKADSMAPLKKTRGGATKFKSKATPTEEIESSGQAASQTRKAKKKPAKKPMKKATKKSNLLDKLDDIDDDVEEVGTSAVARLQARMGVAVAPGTKRPSTGSTKSLNSIDANGRERASPPPGVQAQPRVASTPQVRQTSVARGRTPSVAPNTDDDLYGLSPAGKVSQARLAPRRSSVLRMPMSALRVQGTPGIDASVALQNFKRRPRQPSLIRMVQMSSELGKEDAEGYLEQQSDLDDTLGDFDIQPQDESTPLNFGKKQVDNAPSQKAQEMEGDEPRTSSSRKRKRAETEEDEVQIPGSSPYGSSPPHIEGTTWARNEDLDLPEERVAASMEEQDPIYADPQSQSDIMAPPQSSDPASPKRQRASGAQPASKKQAPKISTAKLESLLPKPKQKAGARTAKRTATYQIMDDTDEENTFDRLDDDQLSRPKARRKTAAKKSTKKPLAAKDANRRATKKAASPKSKQKRTYGRQLSVDKENEDSAFARSLLAEEDEDEDDTIEIEKTGRPKLAKSKELEKAKQKFAAVDEWEMEFESVDLGGGESSPWR